MRGACLISRRSEDESIFFGRASVHCEGPIGLLVPLGIARGGLLNSLVAETAVETLHSTFSENAYLIFSCYQLPFCEFPKHTTALHYRYEMQM
jgi:hypothetical protein